MTALPAFFRISLLGRGRWWRCERSVLRVDFVIAKIVFIVYNLS